MQWSLATHWLLKGVYMLRWDSVLEEVWGFGIGRL